MWCRHRDIDAGKPRINLARELPEGCPSGEGRVESRLDAQVARSPLGVLGVGVGIHPGAAHAGYDEQLTVTLKGALVGDWQMPVAVFSKVVKSAVLILEVASREQITGWGGYLGEQSAAS